VRMISYYHKDTGMFKDHHLTASDDKMVALNTPTDHIAIEGHHDHLSRCVDIKTGEIVDYQPPQPSSDHEWNIKTKRWQFSAEAIERKARKPDALSKIAKLEDSQHRIIREAVMALILGQETKTHYQHLAGIDDEVALLRKILQENI